MYHLGILIVLWVITRLLIIERLPYRLDETITLWQLYIIYFIILGSLLEIKVLLDKLLHRNTNTIIQKITMKYITKYYIQPLLAFQRELLRSSLIISILDICKKPLLSIFKYDKLSITITLYIFFYARIFIVLSLGIDVFYLQHIVVFYKMLYLLIIPLAVNSLLSLLHEHSIKTLNILELTDVFIIHNNACYQVYVKNINLSEKTKNNILDKSKINLEMLSLIANINEIKIWYYFILFQSILSIIFCSLWTYAIVNIVYICES